MTWVLEALKEILKVTIIPSFKRFTLTIDLNGNDDHKISWFKPGKPCADGLKMLEQQMTAFCA